MSQNYFFASITICLFCLSISHFMLLLSLEKCSTNSYHFRASAIENKKIYKLLMASSSFLESVDRKNEKDNGMEALICSSKTNIEVLTSLIYKSN